MKRLNCWEVKGCGGQRKEGLRGGHKCSVPGMVMYDGVHGGTNAGRVCWLISDTFCNGDLQVTFTEKLRSCTACDFYRRVMEEEGDGMEFPLKVLEDLMRGIKG